MDITGAAAVVTGGASGLGEATARLLAERGGQGRRARPAGGEGREGRGRGRRRVRQGRRGPDEEQVTAAVEAASELGPLRILVNSAGLGRAARIIGRDLAFPDPAGDLRVSVLRVNLVGTYNCARLAGLGDGQAPSRWPNPATSRGAILNTASAAAFDGQIGQTPYSASKGGVVGMTLPMARDLARHGIRVNTIAPGLIDTPIYGEGEQAEAFKAALGRSVVYPNRLGKAAGVRVHGGRCLDQRLHERRDHPARRRRSGCPPSSQSQRRGQSARACPGFPCVLRGWGATSFSGCTSGRRVERRLLGRYVVRGGLVVGMGRCRAVGHLFVDPPDAALALAADPHLAGQAVGAVGVRVRLLDPGDRGVATHGPALVLWSISFTLPDGWSREDSAFSSCTFSCWSLASEAGSGRDCSSSMGIVCPPASSACLSLTRLPDASSSWPPATPLRPDVESLVVLSLRPTGWSGGLDALRPGVGRALLGRGVLRVGHGFGVPGRPPGKQPRRSRFRRADLAVGCPG